MRPSPDEVRAWFAGDVTDDELTRHLDILQADPNWRVAADVGPQLCTLALSDSPGAEDLAIVLRRDDAVWRPHALRRAARRSPRSLGVGPAQRSLPRAAAVTARTRAGAPPPCLCHGDTVCPPCPPRRDGEAPLRYP